MFPESQKYITELIALVNNCGHSIVLTTHSPYVLGTLNNLLYAKTISPQARKEANKIIRESLWLDYNAFDSWFVKNGTIENCMDADIHMIQNEKIDISLPGSQLPLGTIHPLTMIREELEDLFIGMGYSIAEGPEVESDHFNFELMNLPKDHPARDMQDTFYIDENTLLRTHTSPVQAHVMLAANGRGPIKVICPGKTYRRDDDDATHSHQFSQCEGLVIDKNITMADLKGTLELFAKKMFGEKREIRLRPSYFPFTEPSVEVDISCYNCNGKGCSMCKNTGWIEILGAGMVNPKVLEMCGFDSQVYQGFAFGIGLERVAMLKYGIDNIRDFYSGDLRFLNQFVRKD